jgi:serine phosphatase RsbU (regulator of sigma subunit)
MADPWDRRNSPSLVGYESWLYQKPCIDSSGDIFVAVPLPSDPEGLGERPNRWLVAVGDICGRGEITSRLKDALETEVIRLAGTMSDPALILKALNHELVDLTEERFATLVVTMIDGDRHELTFASAGCMPPLFRHTDRRVESLAEEIAGLPLWFDPGQTYENVTVALDPGEIVVFHTDGVTGVTQSVQIHDPGCNIDFKGLQLAVAQAPDGATSVEQSILEAIRRFGQGRPQVDDITLFCLGRVAPPTPLGREVSW